VDTAENNWSPQFDLEGLEEEAVFAATGTDVEIRNVSIFLLVDSIVAEEFEFR